MQANNPADIANNLAGQEFKAWLLAAVTAGVDVGEFSIGTVGTSAGSGMGLGAATITLQAGAGTFAASNSNFTTFTVNKRTAGGAPVVLAIGSTTVSGANSTGSMTAWGHVNLTIQAGASVAPGDNITVAITHGGSGLAIPASILELFPSLN
jgi:hypothetical protein